jgi:hypothetical protein
MGLYVTEPHLNTGRHTSWAAHGVAAEAVRVPGGATPPNRPPGAASRKPPIAGVAEQISMPISQFLGNSKFDPETKRIMGLAFEMTRLALGLADRGDIANELIAKRIIELAKAGERNPDLLCESAVKEFRDRLQTSG